MTLEKKLRNRLVFGPLAAALIFCFLTWSLWRVETANSAIRASGLRLETTADELLSTIGYVGMIHDFKNCVIRPDEPEYCTEAQENAARAVELIDLLEEQARDLGLSLDLALLTSTFETYGERAAEARAAHEDGLSILEIDEAVRFDDSAAARQIAATLRLAHRSLDDRLEDLRRIHVIQTLAGMFAIIFVAAWFLVSTWRDHYRSEAWGRRLDAVFSAVSGGLIGLDAKGDIAMLNPTARRMLSVGNRKTPFPWPSDVRLQSRDDPQANAAADNPIRRAAAGESVQSEVYQLIRPAVSGPDVYVLLSGSALENPAPELSAVVLLDDVTVRQRHRQQIERKSRLDALGQLSGGLAHDFNNLLATILYATELSLKEPQTDKARRLLERSVSVIARGRNLTTRLLTFARRQPGRATSRTVRNIFHDFESLARPSIEATVALHFEPPDPGLMIHCDQSQLENALLNLVLNSRDAIRDSGTGSKIWLSARGITSTDPDLLRMQRRAGTGAPDQTSPVTHDFRYVELTVMDDGPGMSEEVRSRATDPFFSTKDAAAGTGLGLAMAYGFVRQANGEMQIYSEIGHGTSVRLILPRGTERDLREEPVRKPRLQKGAGEVILLVEDEPDLLEMMSAVLQDLGYRIVSAKNGREAWDRIEAGLEFDILLSDLVMPETPDGIELARRVRRERPGTPVLLMSGYAGKTASDADGVDFTILQKPCMPETLARELRDLGGG